MSPEAEEIKKETRMIIGVCVKLRKADASRRPDAGEPLSFISPADLVNIPPRGDPGDTASVSLAYEAGLRFWARRAAKQITFRKWQTIAHDLDEEMQDGLRGELAVVSFMESRFDGLTMKDGATVIK